MTLIRTKPQFLIIILLIFSSFLQSCSDPSENVQLETAQFFESGIEPVEKENRIYQKVFDNQDVKSIFVEFNFTHSYLDDNIELPIRTVWYNVRSAVMKDETKIHKINKSWGKSTFVDGYGYAEPGKLPEGFYKVKAFFGDKTEPFAEKTVKLASFETLRNTKKLIKDKIGNLSVESIKFYEADKNGINISRQNRNYKTAFDAQKSRYIFYDITLAYPSIKNTTELDAHISYTLGKKIIYQYQRKVNFEKDWTSSFFTGGVGFPDNQGWDKGDYKVSIYIGDLKDWNRNELITNYLVKISESKFKMQ